MAKSERILMGYIGVDAGLCWIGDPCYVLHAEQKPKALGKNWQEFCEKIKDMEFGKSFAYDLGHEGLGVVVSTGIGDGTYPVYAEISDEGEWGKRVKKVTVEFL